MFTAFARTVTRLNRWIGRFTAWIVVPLFLLLICDVVMRYVAGRPLPWTAELAQLVFGVYGILAGGYLMAERGHVNVDIIYGRFSPQRKATVDVATSFLFFLFIGVLLWQSVDLFLDSIDWPRMRPHRIERSNSVWKPALWPVKLFIPIAASLLLAQGIVRLVADIRVLMGLPVPEDVYGAKVNEGGGH